MASITVAWEGLRRLPDWDIFSVPSKFSYWSCKKKTFSIVNKIWTLIMIINIIVPYLLLCTVYNSENILKRWLKSNTSGNPFHFFVAGGGVSSLYDRMRAFCCPFSSFLKSLDITQSRTPSSDNFSGLQNKTGNRKAEPDIAIQSSCRRNTRRTRTRTRARAHIHTVPFTVNEWGSEIQRRFSTQVTPKLSLPQAACLEKFTLSRSLGRLETWGRAKTEACESFLCLSSWSSGRISLM